MSTMALDSGYLVYGSNQLILIHLLNTQALTLTVVRLSGTTKLRHRTSKTTCLVVHRVHLIFACSWVNNCNYHNVRLPIQNKFCDFLSRSSKNEVWLVRHDKWQSLVFCLKYSVLILVVIHLNACYTRST